MDKNRKDKMVGSLEGEINRQLKKVLFPGTFDPFTIGHASIVERGLLLADEIIIAIGINEQKRTSFSLKERLANIRGLYRHEPRVRVLPYDTLTVDFARVVGAQFILRGVRSVIDFEYEKNMADINRKLNGMETLVLFTEPEYAHISSGMVRELLHYGKDISPFIPKGSLLNREEKQ